MASRASNSYVVRFEGNHSRKWDGKEVYVDKEVLDELYDSSELVHGAKISYPWRSKGGKLTHWNAIFVDPTVSSSATTACSSGVTTMVTSTTSSVKPASTQMGGATALKNNGLYSIYKCLHC